MSRQDVKLAFRSLVESLPRPHGVVAIGLLDMAGYTVAPDRLSKWMSLTHEDMPPSNIVWALQEQAGKTIFSEAMTNAVQRGESLSAGVDVLSSQATFLAAKANAHIAAAKDPSSPGGADITPREAQDNIKAVDKAIDGLNALRDALSGYATVRAVAE